MAKKKIAVWAVSGEGEQTQESLGAGVQGGKPRPELVEGGAEEKKIPLAPLHPCTPAQDTPASLPSAGDDLLRAACARQGVEPESLISFKIYPDKVAIILGDYRKFEYSYADLLGFFTKPRQRQ